MTSDASARQGWLFGPGPDLLLGCGGAYIAIFALLVVGAAFVLGIYDLRIGSWLITA